MAGFRPLADARALIAAAFSLAAAPAWADPAALNGTSPGERAAILAYCGDSRGAIARTMCLTNQVTSLLRLGRKPDLTEASPAQRETIHGECSGKSAPAARFACEREGLRTAGLPVRDEPGGGQVSVAQASAGGMASLSPMAAANLPKVAQPPDFKFFDIEKWRAERPPMLAARGGPAMAADELFRRVAPSIYVVIASDHAVELAERTPHAQGSAVAITDHILLTNCHVVAGRPQIMLSQDGQTDRANLVYADPGGDRCFIKSNRMMLHPIQGVRRFDDLRVGEPVFSVGTPVGLERSLGEGMISGLRQFEGVDIVQNSAPTWHGSSGGGLFDARGNLVGITTAISTTVANLNFSIAAEDFWP
jgi:S1-C subfamily serine protease